MRKVSQDARHRAKISIGKWEEQHPKISVRLAPDQHQQMQKIAKHADLKTSEVVARLLAFALEKLLQQKKQRDGQCW
jgi:hypothetical protein